MLGEENTEKAKIGCGICCGITFIILLAVCWDTVEPT